MVATCGKTRKQECTDNPFEYGRDVVKELVANSLATVAYPSVLYLSAGISEK